MVQFNKVLTAEQRCFFDEHGYIILKNFISDELVQKISDRCKDICEETVDKGVINIVKDKLLWNSDLRGLNGVNKIQDLCYDEVFREYIENEDILRITESVVGSNITCINSMVIIKPPNNAKEMSEHPVHQDQYYFPYRPAKKLLSVWTALETATPENGCLYIIPGSHKEGLREHKYIRSIKNPGFQGVPGFEDVPKLDLAANKGDTIFFHPLLLHGSYENKTKGFRLAINVDYCDSYVEIFDMKGTIQESLATELEEICERKNGKCHTYVEIFQMKSKCVKGDVGNFNTSLQGKIYF